MGLCQTSRQFNQAVSTCPIPNSRPTSSPRTRSLRKFLNLWSLVPKRPKVWLHFQQRPEYQLGGWANEGNSYKTSRCTHKKDRDLVLHWWKLWRRSTFRFEIPRQRQLYLVRVRQLDITWQELRQPRHGTRRRWKNLRHKVQDDRELPWIPLRHWVPHLQIEVIIFNNW